MDHPLRTWIWRNRRFFRLRLIRYGIILEGEVQLREAERLQSTGSHLPDERCHPCFRLLPEQATLPFFVWTVMNCLLVALS